MSDRLITLEAALLDLEGLGLQDLKALDGTVLGDALRRVLTEADGRDPSMGSWNSSV